MGLFLSLLSLNNNLPGSQEKSGKDDCGQVRLNTNPEQFPSDGHTYKMWDSFINIIFLLH